MPHDQGLTALALDPPASYTKLRHGEPPRAAKLLTDIEAPPRTPPSPVIDRPGAPPPA